MPDIQAHIHARKEDSPQARFSNFFRSEVAVAFTFGGAIIGGFIYLTSPVHTLQLDMALLQQSLQQIKNNDLTHIELEINSINTKLEEYNKTQVQQGQQLTEALTILRSLKK